MLLGQADGLLSQKFQTALPHQFRQELGKEIVITKSLDSCLFAVSKDNWHTLLEGTENKPFTDQATRELQRFLFGNAVQVTLDKQGRFLLPEYLRVYAKLQKKITFVGVQRYIEIWDTEIWMKDQKRVVNGIGLLTVNLSKTQGHE